MKFDSRAQAWEDRKSEQDEDTAELTAQKKLIRQDEIDRVATEGKFRQGKRRFGLSRIMVKLAGTSETIIMLTFVFMNLEKMLKKALCFCQSVRLTVSGVN